MKRLVSLILSLLIITFGILLALRNAEQVHFDFYLGSVDLPLSLLLVLAVAVGALLGILAGLGVIIRQRVELRRQRRKAATTEHEVRNLRALPLRDRE